MPTYTERQHLPYLAAQLFDLVADVESYPQFLPWVRAARIRHRRHCTIVVEMTIAAGPVRKSFSSVGVLRRPHRIDICSDDPTFEHFAQRWSFVPAAAGSTEVEYHVDFKFRSTVLQALVGPIFADRAGATIAAFKRRAASLYGNGYAEPFPTRK